MGAAVLDPLATDGRAARAPQQGYRTGPDRLTRWCWTASPWALGTRFGTGSRDIAPSSETASPEDEEADPAVGAFLAFLASDLTQHPERLRGMPRALLRRARVLARGILIDHSTPIEGAVAL